MSWINYSSDRESLEFPSGVLRVAEKRGYFTDNGIRILSIKTSVYPKIGHFTSSKQSPEGLMSASVILLRYLGRRQILSYFSVAAQVDATKHRFTDLEAYFAPCKSALDVRKTTPPKLQSFLDEGEHRLGEILGAPKVECEH
ncbi:hypothetical protein X801_00138, partial [Opisthorchis viverrini]